MASIGEVTVRIDQATCIATISTSVELTCGEAMHEVRLYKRKEDVPARVPTELVNPEQSIGPGPEIKAFSWTTHLQVDGKWHFTVALYQEGVFVTEKTNHHNVRGCNPLISVPPGGLAIPHEGVDELIYLVKVTHPDPNTWTYEKVRVLSATYQMIDWWYSRNGGCGNFRLLLRETFPEAPIALQDGWEVHVDIKLDGETEYTTWYRGVIRAVDVGRQGNEVLTEVRGQGYLEQLHSIQVQRRYPKGITVESIVRDIANNYIKTQSRVLTTLSNNGVDTSSYVLAGPLHFECSALKALKFLSELQGDREFGVAANRQLYFRTKKEVIENAIFAGDEGGNAVEVIEGGKELEKVNQVKIGQKQWGHKEEITIIKDYTDISNYGLYEKPVDVPWVEHRQDAQRWAENLIEKKINISEWRKIAWTKVDRHLEENHPTEGLDQVRIYGQDVSNEFIDLDINKIHYYKGGHINKGEVREIHRPKTTNLIDQPILRAFVYCGPHHKDFVEEMEDKIFEPLITLRAKDKQFRNPRVDVTNPDVNEIDTQPGQLWWHALTSDVTNGPFRPRFREDLTNWPDLVKMRTGDVLPSVGVYPGEEFLLYTNVARTEGTKYYWNGVSWIALTVGGAGSVTSNELSAVSAQAASAISQLNSVVSQGLSVMSQAISVVSQALSNEISNRVSADNALSQAISVLSQANSVDHAALSVRIDTQSQAISVISQQVSVISQALSALSQAVSVLSQTNSAEHAALSVRIDTQSQSISVLSQAISVLSQGLSLVSNAASNALSVANAASQAASVVSQAVSVLSQANSVEHAALSARIDTQSQSLSVHSNQLSIHSVRIYSSQLTGAVSVSGLISADNRISNASSNALSVANAASQAASVVSTAASNALSVANAASNAASIVSQALSAHAASQVASLNGISARSVGNVSVRGLQSVVDALSNRISSGASVTSNELSAASAQAASAISQLNSVVSQGFSLISQTLSAHSQNISTISNAASNALSVANAASNAASVVSQALSVLSQAVSVADAALSSRIDTQSQSLSVHSNQLSIHSVRIYSSQLTAAVSVSGLISADNRISNAASNSLSVANAASNAASNALSVGNAVSQAHSALSQAVSVMSTTLSQLNSVVSQGLSELSNHVSVVSNAVSVVSTAASNALSVANAASQAASVVSTAASNATSIANAVSNKVSAICALSVKSIGGTSVQGLQSALNALSNRISAATGNSVTSNEVSAVSAQAASAISQLNSVVSQGFSLVSQTLSAHSQNISVISNVASNALSVANAASNAASIVSNAASNALSVANAASQAASVVSQALSAHSQANSVADAALSARIDTQSNSISVISQQVSLISALGPYVSLQNVAASAVSAGCPVYLGTSAGTFRKAADSFSAEWDVIGFVADASIPVSAVGRIQTDGLLSLTTAQWNDIAVSAVSGLIPGGKYVLDPVAGKISALSAGQVTNGARVLGYAINQTLFKIAIAQFQDPESELANQVLANNDFSDRFSILSQKISTISQANSVDHAALSVRIDTQSQSISVLSQAHSALSQAVSVLSNTASNATSIANAASNAASVVSNALSNEISNRTSADNAVSAQAASAISQLNSVVSQGLSLASDKISVVSQAVSVVSTAASNALSVANAASQAASVVSTAASNALSVANAASNAASVVSQALSAHKSVLDNLSVLSAGGTSVKGLQSVLNALSNRISGIAGGAGSVTSNEASAISAQAASAISQLNSVVSQGLSLHSQQISVISQTLSALASAHSILSQAHSVLSQAHSVISQKVSAECGLSIQKRIKDLTHTFSAANTPVDSLTASVSAGGTYDIEIQIMSRLSTGAGGNSCAVGLNFPGMVHCAGHWQHAGNALGVAQRGFDEDNANAVLAQFTHDGAANVLLHRMRGLFRVSTTGVVQPIFTLTQNINILPGSYIIARRIV